MVKLSDSVSSSRRKSRKVLLRSPVKFSNCTDQLHAVTVDPAEKGTKCVMLDCSCRTTSTPPQ